MSWLYTRHFLFIQIIWSTAFDLPVKAEMIWEPERGFYMSMDVVHGFVALLCALEVRFGSAVFQVSIADLGIQVIQIVWCFMIFNIAYRVVTGQGADDSRSDDEG